MAAYKYPRSVVLVEDLAKTVTGKTLRRSFAAGAGMAARRPGNAVEMTTPQPKTPEPRDIALELATPEQAADLEAQSDPETPEVQS